MRMPTQKQRPRKAQVASFPAPTGGLVSNRNLAMARGPDVPPGASVLENWFVTATGVILRRGSKRWASINQELPIRALFTYSAGGQREMFAANDDGIWNVTTVPSPYTWGLASDDEEFISPDVPGEVAFGVLSVEGLDVLSDTTSGDWSVAQYTTSAGAYLLGVNGADVGFIYDGTAFYPLVSGGVYGIEYDALTVDFTTGETLTGATSGATAEILKVIANGTTGTLWLSDIVEQPEVREITFSEDTGSFTVDRTLTGATSGATATIDAESVDTLTLSGVSGAFVSGEAITDGGAATTAGAETATRWDMAITTVVTPFVVGETVAGGTSGATAVVLEVSGTTLTLRNLSGSFEAAEAITGSLGGDAEVDTAEVAHTWVLLFNEILAAFTVDETVVGATSGATALIDTISTGSETGSFVLTSLTGNFVEGEVITDRTSATSTSVDTYASGGPFRDDEALSDSDTGAATADGSTSLLAPGISFPDGSELTTAGLSHVWIYKQRIWFVEKNSLNAWYLPVDQVGGELTLWPMGGVFGRGGVLLWGQAWSLDSGGAGGLSEQCVFTTTEGEIAAYQGLSPEIDQGWSKVGVYRVGKPLGRKAFFQAGGDIAILTTVGLISLASASRLDYAALGQNAISYPIEDDWARAVQERGQDDWRCQVWADGQMVLVAPPTPDSKPPIVYAANANTGKWGLFTGWDVTCFEVFNGGIFFGSSDGAVRQAWVGGSDEGKPYVGKALPLFDGFDAPASLKVLKMARAVTRSAYPAQVQVSGHANFKANFPSPPSQGNIPTGNEWDNGIWGEAVWDANRSDVVTGDWVSIGGSGHDVAVGVQITSGSVSPIDEELIRIDVTYTTGDVGT